MNARFAAHPLVVAAAFGLLGPAAMAEDDDDLLPESDLSLTSGEPGSVASSLADAPAIDPAEFARVEAEWFKVRGLK